MATVITIREAAERLGMAPGKVLRAIKKGRLAAFKRGWIWLINVKAIQEFEKQRAA